MDLRRDGVKLKLTRVQQKGYGTVGATIGIYLVPENVDIYSALHDKVGADETERIGTILKDLGCIEVDCDDYYAEW